MKGYAGYVKLSLNPELQGKIDDLYATLDRARNIIMEIEHMDKLVPAVVATADGNTDNSEVKA